jgi:membrane-associated phospholipid phosphatase
MRRLAIIWVFVAGMAGGAFGQSRGDSLFRIKPAVDIPLVAGGAALDIYNFAKIGQRNSTSVEKLNGLKISDLDWFDRWGVHPYSHSVDQLSYVPFYVAMPLPLIVFGIDNRMRQDFWKLTYLYGETMILTGVLYTSAVHWIPRLRPLTYEAASPLEERQASNSRNSFFAGHVALVGTSLFFIASTWSAYHPESDLKWVFYTGAGAITALTGYWRSRAGEHFPSDIAVGALVGAGMGILVPRFHMPRKLAQRVSFAPVGPTGPGLTLAYKFG